MSWTVVWRVPRGDCVSSYPYPPCTKYNPDFTVNFLYLNTSPIGHGLMRLGDATARRGYIRRIAAEPLPVVRVPCRRVAPTLEVGVHMEAHRTVQTRRSGEGRSFGQLEGFLRRMGGNADDGRCAYAR